MRFLLDTHVWLWWVLGSDRFGDETRRILFDPSATLYLSVASVWELSIKYALGKLTLPGPPSSYVTARAAAGDFHVVDVRLPHAALVAELPRHHDDPFDRMLIAQSIVEGYRLVTADRHMRAYGIDVITA